MGKKGFLKYELYAKEFKQYRAWVMRNKTKQKGFTLVELMVVMVILAILGGIVMPELLNALPNMRLRSAARDIYSAMMQAKVEAIRRGENTTLLFDPVGNTYTMFIDNGDGAGGAANDEVINGTELVLVAATPLPNRVTFDPNGVTDLGVAFANTTFANNAMVFTSRGIPASAANNPPSGLGGGTVGLRATDSNGNTQRQRNITASTAGRITISVK
jgi:prepilin-type N-terminal cleavage/methylation domain-containing protein